MRLSAACQTDRVVRGVCRIVRQSLVRSSGEGDVTVGVGRPQSANRRSLVHGGRIVGRVAVGWDFIDGQRVGFLAAGLAEIIGREALALPEMQWDQTLEVRQSEVSGSVATLSGAQQREQGLVLDYRQ